VKAEQEGTFTCGSGLKECGAIAVQEQINSKPYVLVWSLNLRSRTVVRTINQWLLKEGGD
jgi:hypothetical protein